MTQRSAKSSAQWSRYLDSHHGHVGLAADDPLRGIEFDANFGPHLPPTSARVLDIGVGQGLVLRELARRGYRNLVGWDIAEDCIAQAHKNGVPGQLEHVDALEGLARVGAGSFDCILAKDLLEHLPREQVVDFLCGVHRALAPGGVFLARLPNMANPLSVFLRYDDFTHTMGFTENSLRQVFVLGGFERSDVSIEADRLPALALLRHALVPTFVMEKVLGPGVRALVGLALRSQRKGPPKVDTLRLVVVARRSPTPGPG